VRRPARASQKSELVQIERQVPGDDSLAKHEAALLRWCRGALFGPTGFAPCNQATILWLTWRFYGWLVRQLRLFRDKRGNRAYFEAVRRLAEAAPTKGEVVDDVLDPTGFDESGSHRFMAIVHALGVGAVTERIDGNVSSAMPSTASLGAEVGPASLLADVRCTTPVGDATQDCPTADLSIENMVNVPPETAACVSCHTAPATAVHAEVNTSSSGAESCATCHGTGKSIAVEAVHASAP
jgi:hypothetical protein